MTRKRLLLLFVALRLVLVSSGCAVGKAPAALRHPMLEVEGGAPHTAPFARVEQPRFDGDPAGRSEDPATQELRAQVAQAARSYVGRRRIAVEGTRLPFDCSGLARAAYMHVGVDLTQIEPEPGENAVRTIFRYARAHGIVYHEDQPAVGDLVFFHDTYDRNGNGRRDDPLTHVAVVEQVDDDGTVTIVHRVSRGVLRYRMNLRHPEQTRLPGGKKRINHFLRQPEDGLPSQTTAQLFAGYATVIRDAGVVPTGSRVAVR